MSYSVSRVEVWTGEIEDQPGGVTAKLEPLAAAGADLEFVIARREPHRPGKGVVFLGPVSGAKAKRAATTAGLAKAGDLVALRVEGPNRPGVGAELTRRLADAGISLRGLSAAVRGDQFVALLALDSAEDATKAGRLLRAAGGKQK